MARKHLVCHCLFLLLFFFYPLHQCYSTNALNNENKMDVHFIDVGQGDSIFVELPNGKRLLIDGGPPSSGRKLVNYLKNEGVESIDILISTHPDIDHLGGLIPVIEQFHVKKIIDSGKLYYTPTYFHYIEEVYKRDIPVTIAKTGHSSQLAEGISVKILNSHRPLKTNNQSSIALLLSFKEIDFLLMGDVESDQELRMIQQHNLKSEILKVAHHGSATSSSYEFLQEVKPEMAVLSYSKDNHYGHPVRTIVDNLLRVGATIYSTAKAGDIVVTTDGTDYSIDVSGKDRLIYMRNNNTQ
ncbi:ComEC/Rec2 family competence protein [Aquibacillus albus]|uniref:Beta-lactamase superfamily II metal-dependent hydrolase n=1 Tax=Aquibacillus albus TaxID=1168171 RepID=A0ABS2N2S1_9BACI|nr:MBL fold metallo-hydrolase [Aquibacillus albus]MBM7572436.1 beta-lactamase superfamily II metal-dependent hydrolase [Aquibacillus albus]